ncbi:hypothetical protein BASA61_004435 [Batrachochytrium salamandrivorans]|nr:hypothetical protein BASA60_006773 [Batrachochytrium salamandrivorans]KAH6592886.1 hypothetical protein BASA61_004435 [Batrachochytrium salamandrivorans]
MVALVQVLIAAVLIPFAFAAPPVNVNGSDLTTRSFESLSVSPDFRCGAAAGFGCAPGFCCSQHNFCGITPEHCDFGCQPEFSLCDSTRGPESPRPESSNGRCGSGTVFGCGLEKCCSRRGLCGTTTRHCGVGCQSAFGLCKAVRPPVG